MSTRIILVKGQWCVYDNETNDFVGKAKTYDKATRIKGMVAANRAPRTGKP